MGNSTPWEALILRSVPMGRGVCGNRQDHGPLNLASPFGAGPKLSPRWTPLFQASESQPIVNQEVHVGRHGAMLLWDSAPEPSGETRTFYGVPVDLPGRAATSNRGTTRTGWREVDGGGP